MDYNLIMISLNSNFKILTNLSLHIYFPIFIKCIPIIHYIPISIILIFFFYLIYSYYNYLFYSYII